MGVDVLIVDDEADIRELVSDILRDEGYDPRVAADSDSALKAIAERVPAVIVLDIWLQGSELDGLGILELVTKKFPHVPVVMISGHGNIETAVASIKMGAYDFIEKPFKADRLLLVIARALEAVRLRHENTDLKQRGKFESHLVGTSTTLAQLRQAVEKVAPTASRVLITGGPGTGKEMAARLIHAKSPRAASSFVVLHTAGLSPERVEVELFGVEESNPNGGAEKLGAFERAHGGTLFIDEVAEMPLEVQGKILRTLQEQAFMRVGGNRRVAVDVRVIAATNRDLPLEIQIGRFREDLYYRLNVVPLRVPALRERKEDIPELCSYFLRRSAEMSGVTPRELSPDAAALLQTYDWPGNVRQLRNMMEWLLIMAPGAPGEPITGDMLPQDILHANPLLTRPELNSDIMSMALREARELFEKQYLAAQIDRFGGNISRTSTFIGMERSALHRKLKMLGLAGNDVALEEKLAG